MKRYYNKVTKTESLEQGENIVELPFDNPFFNPLPKGKRLTYDKNNIPNGTEDIPSPSAEQIEELRISNLKSEALTYQSSQQSQNELGLLHGYSSDDLLSKPKAQAQINWMTSLFALHNEKKADATNDTPFSSVGDKPHSFDELYNEKFS